MQTPVPGGFEGKLRSVVTRPIPGWLRGYHLSRLQSIPAPAHGHGEQLSGR